VPEDEGEEEGPHLAKKFMAPVTVSALLRKQKRAGNKIKPSDQISHRPSMIHIP